MVEVEELVVAARPEGIDDTRAELESLEGTMGEVGGGLEDSVGMLEGLEQAFTGAMSAILVGLGAATAGLLAQVPVVNELMSGLGSVLNAIAFRLDQQLRPALEPLTNAFFKLSEAIFEVDGPMGKLVDTILVFSTTLGVLAGALGAAQLAATPLAAAIGAISTPVLAVVGAVSALVAVWTTDFLGIKSTLLGVWDTLKTKLQPVADLIEAVAGAFLDFGAFTLDVAKLGLNTLEDVLDGAAGFASDIWGFLQDLGGFFLNVADIGLQALQATLMGAKNFAEDALNVLNDIAGSVFKAVIDIGAKIADVLFGGDFQSAQGTQSNVDRGDLNVDVTNPVGDGAISSTPNVNIDLGNINNDIDGRRVSEETGEYTFEDTVSRGG